MSLMHYLFGFSGRINRAKQWAVLLVSLVHNIILGIAFSFTIGFVAVSDLLQKKTSWPDFVANPQVHVFAAIFCILFVVGLYIGVAVATKRLHDRNKSPWWLLLFFLVPIVLSVFRLYEMLPVYHQIFGTMLHPDTNPMRSNPFVFEPPLAAISGGVSTLISLWAFVELYCLPGTPGENRYGPDPLAR